MQDSKDFIESKNITLAELDSKEDSKTNDNIETSAKSHKLNAVTATANNENKVYDSSKVISKEIIESSPNGNGDISSILKILPNVQINNASRSSNSPGEINPANISISGSLPYQNSFQIDGFNMNNDINPAGASGNAWATIRGSQSQGLNIDTSLLDSINVQDSNISAAYGGFSGGVVEANVRKPRKKILDSIESSSSNGGLTGTDKTDSIESSSTTQEYNKDQTPTHHPIFGNNGLYGWHFDTSYQITANELTTYHIPDNLKEVFESSSNENYQPNFTKHAFRANLEGYITQNLGMIFSYNTRRSYIPLQAYTNNTSTEQHTQHRIADNYYVKLNYDINENVDIDFHFAYMPSDNSYFTPNRKNSRYSMVGGGIQTGLKAKWQSELGLWTNTLGYSRLEHSRRSDANYYTNINGSEGQWGSTDQIQNTINFKSDMIFDSISWWRTKHIFRSGFELGYQIADVHRLSDVYSYINGDLCNIDGTSTIASCNKVAGEAWNGQVDNFGFISANATQYYNGVAVISGGKNIFNTFSYALYLEDDSSLDLGNYGILNARFGLRLDGDNYLNKHKVAPRFSLSYIAPWIESYQTQFIFGANRYYGRNLISYRIIDAVSSSRVYYSRNGANEAFVFNSNMTNSAILSSLKDLDVPYDDELMGAYTQNIAGIFSLNLKYIHRNGKMQVMRDNVSATTSPNYQWTNGGSSVSDIITLSIQNITPIDTFGIKHFYMLSLDYNNTIRNFHTYTLEMSDFYERQVYYNGVATTFRNIPPQKVNEPFTLRLSTTHTFNISRYKFLWNNFFRYKGSYERIVIENPLTPANQRYVDKTFKPTFMWDMRLGFEVDIWRKNTLYVNLDIYNVLNLKNEIALSAADGFYMYNVPSQVAISMNELGTQLWLQAGYKF